MQAEVTNTCLEVYPKLGMQIVCFRKKVRSASDDLIQQINESN